MKGDFTRSTFKPEKNYSGVRMQQGRVQLDADWNEQIDINSHRVEKEARDIIGPSGAPLEGGGFKIDPKANKKNLIISHGSIYVDGILCENFNDVDITGQENLPDYQLPANEGIYLAYLDVWQRHITAIEDPQIREVALGGPDTATRTKTIWQVKLKFVQNAPEKGGPIDCQAVNSEWNNIIEKSDDELTAFTKQEVPSKNPCIVSPGAGYRRLENQLYRVEIHTGGKPNEAKFKWSRDNGSVVFAVKEFVKDASNNPTNKLKVKQLGKDKTLSLKAGDWVEVLDDVTELSENLAGTLAQITENPDVAGHIITLNQVISGFDMMRHPRVRRWDQQSDAISIIPPSGSDSIELEDGIYVRFSGNSFKAGDYWLIPARTATENTQETGKIEWPQDESKNPPEPVSLPPEGIKHHYCRLAVLQQDGSKNWSSLGDCRKLFPSVTELTNFFHVCGDGQEAMPGKELPDEGYLQVGVSNGKQPVANATVRFHITRGSGTITSTDGSKTATGEGNSIEVLTENDGIASCKWKLDTGTQRQQVEATLRDTCDAQVNIPIRFNANLSVAGEVAYTLPGCTDIDTSNGIPTVQELLKQKVSGWPPVDDAGNVTVKDVLDTLLCKLDAGEVPYNPVIKGDRWKDINEVSNLGTPPVPNTVQDALDDLVANLDSSDIPYRPLNCGNTANPTVRSLLNISANADSKVKDILDALLCNFNAKHLPLEKNDICKRLKDDASVKTVQDALNALCNLRGGCCVIVDDEEHLKKALEELKDGGIICLLAGEFKIGDLEIKGLSNIVISGCTLASRLIADIHIVNCKNVVIEDLDISGSVEAEEVDGLFLKENIISQTDEKHIFKLTKCSSVKIEKNMLRTYSGIIFDGNDIIEISDNIISSLQSVENPSWGILVGSSKELKILRNRLNIDVLESNNQEHGHIRVISGQYVDVENNLIHTNVSGDNKKNIIYGIELSKVIGLISIIGNRIEGVNGEAVIIDGSRAARIYGNKLSSSNSNAVMARGNELIELLGNTINSDAQVIRVDSGKDLKMWGNLVETNASVVMEKDRLSIVAVSRLQGVDISDNRITALNPDGIPKEHVSGLIIDSVNGMVSVNNNRVNGVNQEAVYMSNSEKTTAMFHDNSFDSLWNIDSIATGITISSTILECMDIIFSGNNCTLKIPDNNENFIALLKKDNIKIRQVFFPIEAGRISAMGNRCRENLVEEHIYSIFAPNDRTQAIFLGNITTNKISHAPDPQKLNLRG